MKMIVSVRGDHADVVSGFSTVKDLASAIPVSGRAPVHLKIPSSADNRIGDAMTCWPMCRPVLSPAKACWQLSDPHTPIIVAYAIKSFAIDMAGNLLHHSTQAITSRAI